MDKSEFRYVAFRAEGDKIIGTVVKYGDEARFGVWTETFEAGSLRFSDVIVNLQHDRGRPVVRSGAGLELRDSLEALVAEIHLPNTTYAREARELVDAGILRGLSMEFRAKRDSWNGKRRTVNEAELFGIGIVDRPAYSDSTIAERFGRSFVPVPKVPRKVFV